MSVVHKRRWTYPGSGEPGVLGPGVVVRACDGEREAEPRTAYWWKRVTCRRCLALREKERRP